VAPKRVLRSPDRSARAWCHALPYHASATSTVHTLTSTTPRHIYIDTTRDTYRTVVRSSSTVRTVNCTVQYGQQSPHPGRGPVTARLTRARECRVATDTRVGDTPRVVWAGGRPTAPDVRRPGPARHRGTNRDIHAYRARTRAFYIRSIACERCRVYTAVHVRRSRVYSRESQTKSSVEVTEAICTKSPL
jgi:hypothetical protein